MKKVLIASTILSTLIYSQAFAKAENFEGVSASFGLGMVGSSSSYEYRGSDSNSDHQLGENGVVGVVNLSYLKAVNDKWLLGGGISYDLNSLKTGESTNIIGGSSYAAKTISKNHVSIYIQPTYAINDKTALFAKLGYHSTRVELTDANGQLYSNFQNYTGNLHGLGYGLGLMTFLDQNLFLKAEMEFVNYQKTHIPYAAGAGNLNYKLNTVSGIFSVGYRF